MKKIKIIQDSQLDFHPEQILSKKDMKGLTGGFCFCNKNRFGVRLQEVLSITVCDDNCFLNL